MTATKFMAASVTRGRRNSMRHAAFRAFVLAIWLGCGSASAQDTAGQEAARRAMVLAHSPSDAAKVLFGREATPTAGPVPPIGASQPCFLIPAAAPPPDGPYCPPPRPPPHP